MKNSRLLSLDTLRGFDMLFIMGFAPFIVSLNNLFPSDLGDAIAGHMRHVTWDGFSLHDMIFPLFLFVAGISFPFSLDKQRDNGASSRKIGMKIIRRGMTLVLLGILYNGFFQYGFTGTRYASVLGRIGTAWMLGAFIYMYTTTAVRYGIMGIILIGYWLSIWLIPAPDVMNAAPFSIEGNLVGYVDRLLLPGKLLCSGRFDPEGLLSTLPAIVTALLGMTTGEWVRIPEQRISGNRKALFLVFAGVVLCLVGLAWDKVFPINKSLWSSSFVCFSGGLSFLLFSLFYWVIDVKKMRSWTLFFRVIGLNSITIYMAQRIIGFNQMNHFFFGGLAGLGNETIGTAILRLGYIACCWFFLYFLYRKNIFLKV